MCVVSDHSHDMKIWNEIVVFIMKAIELRHKNLIVRVDLTYPESVQYPSDNALLSKFLDSFKHYCDRNSMGSMYFWVREESIASYVATHHYHLFFLFNGRFIQNPYLVLERVTSLWGRALGCDARGLVHYCTHNNPLHSSPYAIQIRRTSPDFETVMDEVWGWVQYLAKLYSKEEYLYKTKSFSHSII